MLEGRKGLTLIGVKLALILRQHHNIMTMPMNRMGNYTTTLGSVSAAMMHSSGVGLLGMTVTLSGVGDSGLASKIMKMNPES